MGCSRPGGSGGGHAPDLSVTGHIQLFLGGTWFQVIGVMKPVTLDPNLDTTAFIALPVAERLFQAKTNASEIYLRANVNSVPQVSNLLAATADPQTPDGVTVSRPSDALEARAAAKGHFTTLLIGAVAGIYPAGKPAGLSPTRRCGRAEPEPAISWWRCAAEPATRPGGEAAARDCRSAHRCRIIQA